MHPILVPTDFSPVAGHAAQAAIQLAERLKCTIHFIHVIETPLDWPKLEQSKEELYPETKAKVTEAHNQMKELIDKAEAKGIEALPFIYFNESITQLMEHLKRHAHDLIIMGTYGFIDYPGDYLGSNTQKVMRYAKSPVLILKEKFDINQLKDVLLAYDLSEMGEKVVHQIMPLFKQLEVKVHLLYINTPFNFRDTFTTYEKMKRITENHPSLVESENILNYYNQEEGILQYKKIRHFDMIALVTYARLEITRALMGSLAEEVVKRSEMPVLVVNEKYTHKVSQTE